MAYVIIHSRFHATVSARRSPCRACLAHTSQEYFLRGPLQKTLPGPEPAASPPEPERRGHPGLCCQPPARGARSDFTAGNLPHAFYVLLAQATPQPSLHSTLGPGAMFKVPPAGRQGSACDRVGRYTVLAIQWQRWKSSLGRAGYHVRPLGKGRGGRSPGWQHRHPEGSQRSFKPAGARPTGPPARRHPVGHG